MYVGAVTAKTDTTVTNPYIKIFDNDTNRGNVQIIGGTNVTVSSNSSKAITINSSYVNTEYLTNTLAHLNTGTDTVGKLQTAKNLHDWLNGKNYALSSDLSNKVDKNTALYGTTGANHYKRLYNVASLSGPSNSNTPIGDIVITLPIKTSTAWSAEIILQQPSIDCRLIIEAYSTNNSNRKVTQLTGFGYVSEVKFGRDGASNTVLIIKRATGTSGFSYGRVNIATFDHYVSYNVALADPANYKVEFIDELDIPVFTQNGVVTYDNFGKDPRYALSSHSHDASDISTGTLATARIPNLDSSKITTGTLALARIPTGTTSSTVALGNHTHSYLPLSGGTLTGTVTANNPITEAVIQKTSASGLAVLRMLSTGQSHDKGLGLSLSGDLIFGDWSAVATLSSSWNKI